MRVPQSYIQKCKVAAHILQVLFIFIGACIAIAVLTKDGETGGAVTFYFALVCFPWLSEYLSPVHIANLLSAHSASSPSPPSYTS